MIGRLKRALNKKAYLESQHVNFYTPDSIAKKMENAGLNVTEVKGFGFLSPIIPLGWFILWCTPVFKLGNWISQRVMFTADSLFLVAKKR